MTITPPHAISADLLVHLATIGEKALGEQRHAKLCGCDKWPANCPDFDSDTWHIAESLALALPAVLADYEQTRAKVTPVAPGAAMFLFEGCRNGTHACPVRYDGYGGTLICTCDCHGDQL